MFQLFAYTLHSTRPHLQEV